MPQGDGYRTCFGCDRWLWNRPKMVGPALVLGVIGDLGIGVKAVWDKLAEELGGSYGMVEVKK
jgi:hypothetical protein